ncbi:MAG: sigma-70 family RNA polymerase sigma factor [Gammaproteobacteria bacterium]|nr:sigma-70 family RNA polymerase sigma factor [Gammaproteobacteria bacterium]
MNVVYENIEQYIPQMRIYALAMTHDPAAADDLVQDGLVRALSKSQQYRAGTNMRAWLFTILHNVHVSSLRRPSKNAVHVDIEVASRTLQTTQDTQEQNAHRELISRALEALSPGQLELLERAALSGDSYEAIADSEGIAVGTVKSRVSRGRQALRRALIGSGYLQ